jgi:deoxyribodipyrimidine photo-lyase
MARSGRPVKTTPQGDGVEEPAVWSVPQGVASAAPQAADVNGRDVWLVHPWALGEPPADLPAGCVRVGLRLAEHHNAWPWSAARWAFVNTRMAELTPLRWHADRQSLAQALAGARSVQTLADPHVSALLPPRVVQREAVNLFPEVRMHCTSFSAWWNRTTRGVKTLGDLPGLAAG